MRLIVVNHVSLDGVFQGPARSDEDVSDGFERGGWAEARGSDPEVAAALGEVIAADSSWLFGRRSYEGMLSHWNEVGGPFRSGLNDKTKYVASSDSHAELAWPHSELLTGDVPDAVAALRAREGGSLVVMGSGELVRSLLPHGLVDEMLLMVHPVVVGAGRRLLGPTDRLVDLVLAEARPTASGVVLMRYGAAA